MKRKLFVIRYSLFVKKFLISYSLFVILLITGYWLLATAASASTVDDVVERIQKKYGKIQDMQGNFSQTSFLKDLERVETYEGEFFIKKPFSMKWSYSKPRDEEVIIRGVDTWIYKKSENQVIKIISSKDNYSQVPIALLGSLGDLKTDFNISMTKADTLELTPRRKMGFIKKVLLEVNSGDFPVKKISIYDIHGNKIIIAIRNVKVNSRLKDSFFIFKAPPGVEVFDFSQ